MKHNYFNLNQNASKNDGQVPRNVQMSRYCPQPDSVSNPCRCRDLATPRVFSAVLSARAWKYVAMIFAVLMLSIANIGMAWGADFTPAEIVASGGTSRSNIKVSAASVSSDSKNICSGTKQAAAVISSSANASWNDKYIEIQATSGTISTLSLKARGNTDGSGAMILVFWAGDASATYTSYTTSYNYLARNGADCDGSVSITVPANTKTVRIYKGIKVKNGSFDGSSGCTVVSTETICMFGISATASGGGGCTAPNHVDITATRDHYTPGQTMSFTATAYSSAGTGSPITSNITYQWQKYNGSSWVNVTNGTSEGTTISGATTTNLQIANCVVANGGSYRCTATVGGSCATSSAGYHVRVWTFNGNYSGSGFVANNITWTSATEGTIAVTLNANSTYEFKVYDNDGKYFGCNSGISQDASNWTFRTSEGNCSLSTGKVAGTYTFAINVANVGDNTITLSVTYPNMTIYMSGGSTTWCSADPVFFAHAYKGGTSTNVKMTKHSCEDIYYADVPSYNTNVVFTRQKPGSESIAWYGNENFWNKSDEITIGSNNKFTCTGWNTTPEPDQGSFSGSVYSPTTYTVSAAASPAGYGTVSAASVTGVACGTSISTSSNTLTVGATNVTAAAASATAEYTYAFDNWTWTPAGATVTSDVTATANFTRTPKSYTLTWNLAGGKVTVAGTGAAVNATGTPNSEVAFGTAITAPTVTKTGYNFSAWSSSVASTMPAANTTYTATWTAKTTTITINANTSNHGSTTPGTVTATYGSALPSFTAAAGESGYSLTGYFTAATEGDKIINADGTLVASTDYADGSGNWKYETATLTLYAQYESAAVQTALVANTLYEVPDMIPSGASLTSSDQFFDGLSANTKFELIGSGSGSTTPKVNNNSSNDKTIDGITFDDGSMWFKGNADLTSNIPTTFGLSFIVPEGGGKLYLYFSGTSTNIKLAKSGASGSKPSCASGYGEVDVTAGTYYLYGTGTTSPYCFYGLKLCSTYSVSITPTNVTKETGATGAGAAIHGKAYTATFTANTGYTLPSNATVSIGGTPQTKGSGYTWTISDGTATLTIPAANVTGAISITVTGVAAESYSITYHCNGAESGCPSDVAATTNLPSPLPTGLTKDGYDFGGWFTDSECTVAAVAGAALTGNTDLYAKWTERGSECEDTPHAWDVIATSAKSYKVRISKVTEDVAIPIADATASNLTAYAGTSSTSDNVTVQIADGGSSKYGYKFDGSNTYLKLVFSTPLVLNDTLVISMTNASHNISFTTTATRSTTLSTSGGKLIIPAALAGQSTIYLWRGSGTTMYLRSFAVKHECEAIPSCTTPTLPTATLSNQTVCEGSDIAAWDATPTNASTISGKSESISYSWKKKGNDTELATTATFDLGSSAAESQAGTYVVTVTVSKAGYTSASASKEVELTVTEGEEVTGITADKATVYPGNSVTLTATANVTPNSWQWYTCTSAEGAGAAIISGAESASYNIASAPAAGTYYYKAVATGDCGTAERVYTLVVSPAAGGDCETEIWVVKAADLPEGATAATHITTPFTGGSNESASITIDGNTYTITQRTSNATGPATIVVPEGNTATLYILVKGNNGRSVILEKGGVEQWTETPEDGWQALSVDNLAAGTYSLRSSNNLGWGLLALKLCSASACTDPEVTASADNTTACVGTSVTFTAANAHASATYQWQKLDGTWTNISGATESTYTIASVVAGDAGKYRVIASHDCNRTSNEVTLSVPSAPNFGSTVPASVSVMQTIALSINTVEATDATKYKWYKSAHRTLAVSPLRRLSQ